MNMQVSTGNWHPLWHCITWHVFNEKCQVAGPYKTKEEAVVVMKEMLK